MLNNVIIIARVDNMKYEKSCGAVVIKENNILLIEQKSGFYSFSKGHMEKF